MQIWNKLCRQRVKQSFRFRYLSWHWKRNRVGGRGRLFKNVLPKKLRVGKPSFYYARIFSGKWPTSAMSSAKHKQIQHLPVKHISSLFAVLMSVHRRRRWTDIKTANRSRICVYLGIRVWLSVYMGCVSSSCSCTTVSQMSGWVGITAVNHLTLVMCVYYQRLPTQIHKICTDATFSGKSKTRTACHVEKSEEITFPKKPVLLKFFNDNKFRWKYKFKKSKIDSFNITLLALYSRHTHSSFIYIYFVYSLIY